VTFAAPLWFWSFAVFPFLIALAAASERRRTELLNRIVAARLAPKLAGTVSLAKRRLRFAFLLLALAGVIVTLARPQWGFTWEQAKRKGRDILIAIDTSRSMLADDLKPSRLVRAKLAAQDLISELRGDRVGIVAFAGTAFLQAPLTIDYGAVLNSLKELDTEVIPQGGSNLEGAIKAARDAFGKGESENRALIIFSDGEELDANAQKAAEDLKGQVRVFTVGLGTPEGALIPVRGRDGGTEFVKDETGQVVRTKLDESRLQAIAEPTGGFYVHLETGRPEMQQIVRDGLGKMTEQDIDAKLSRRPIERYQWPLSGALLALVAAMLTGERRRGRAIRVGAVAMLLAFPLTAAARNEGLKAYERQDYTGARQEFTKQLERRPDLPELQFDLGSSAYKAGDYNAALAAFGRALTSSEPQLRTKAAYNLGNTLFQRGAAQQEKKGKLAEWKNALQHYDEALKADPKNEDAAYNREVVRKLIEELEKEPPKQDDKKKEDQKKDQQEKNKDNKDQQQQDKQNQQQQPQTGDQKKEDQKPQSGSGQDQDQQKQDGSQQPPPNKENEKGKDEKDQQSASAEDQKPDEGAGKDQKPDQQEGQKSPEKQGDKRDGQAGDQKGQNNAPPMQPEQKKEGELKSAPEAGEGEQQTPEEQAAADAQAAAEGKMTPQQASALLESLKGEDQKVRLLDPRERRALRRVFKDW